MDETRGERRAPASGQPDTNTPPRERDPHASPLGRGADPGSAGDVSPLSGAGSIAGQRGHGSQGERGGPSGFLARENEDSVQEAREAPAGHASSAHDADA